MLKVLGQLVALTITPVILISGMALDTALYAILSSFIGTSALASVVAMLICSGFFIGVVWACYYWTKTSGIGLLALE